MIKQVGSLMQAANGLLAEAAALTAAQHQCSVSKVLFLPMFTTRFCHSNKLESVTDHLVSPADASHFNRFEKGLESFTLAAKVTGGCMMLKRVERRICLGGLAPVSTAVLAAEHAVLC